MAEPTNEQRKAIGAFVRGTLSPLIEEVLTKKLSQSAAYIAEELSAEAALAHSVSDEQIDAVWDALPGGRDAFLTQWGYRTFARAILELVAPDGVPTCPPVSEATAMWDRFVAYHARRIGVEPDKLKNLIGGAEGLKRDFLDAQEEHVTRGVPGMGAQQTVECVFCKQQMIDGSQCTKPTVAAVCDMRNAGVEGKSNG